MEVAKAWEREFYGTEIPGAVRKVAMRTAVVLGRAKGTVMYYFLGLARLRLGGTMGKGSQRVSWIHEDDFCRTVEWLIEHREMDGIVNVVSPGAVTNAEFMASVRAAAGVNLGLPAARWMLEVGARVLRTETELILKSRWVVPERLEQHGFTFQWPDLDPALRDLASLRKAAREDELTKKFASAK